MTRDDFELHTMMIRLLKGMLNAYESWVTKRGKTLAS